jgi:hypothetical protein
MTLQVCPSCKGEEGKGRCAYCDGTGSVVVRESGWLIETRSKPPMWWTGLPDFESAKAWGTANQAIRFARKEDAENCAMRQGALTSDFEATSHEWV